MIANAVTEGEVSAASSTLQQPFKVTAACSGRWSPALSPHDAPRQGRTTLDDIGGHALRLAMRINIDRGILQT